MWHTDEASLPPAYFSSSGIRARRYRRPCPGISLDMSRDIAARARRRPEANRLHPPLPPASATPQSPTGKAFQKNPYFQTDK